MVPYLWAAHSIPEFCPQFGQMPHCAYNNPCSVGRSQKCILPSFALLLQNQEPCTKPHISTTQRAFTGVQFRKPLSTRQDIFNSWKGFLCGNPRINQPILLHVQENRSVLPCLRPLLLV